MKKLIGGFGIGLKKAYTFYKWLNVVGAFLRHMSNFYDEVKQILGHEETEPEKPKNATPHIQPINANASNTGSDDGKGKKAN